MGHVELAVIVADFLDASGARWVTGLSESLASALHPLAACLLSLTRRADRGVADPDLAGALIMSDL